MKTLLQLKKRFDTRLRLAQNSTLFSDSDKNEFINDAITWVGSQYKWSQREMCVSYVSGTEAGEGYYDYPNSPVQFAPMSIRTLVINNIKYEQIDYYDLMKIKRGELEPKQQNPHYFANFGTWFFIYPVIDIEGLPIEATGVVKTTSLSSNTDHTIWSDDMEELNEAVVNMAMFNATGKPDYFMLAQNIVNSTWQKFVSEKQKDVPLDRPFFQVPDFMKA